MLDGACLFDSEFFHSNSLSGVICSMNSVCENFSKKSFSTLRLPFIVDGFKSVLLFMYESQSQWHVFGSVIVIKPAFASFDRSPAGAVANQTVVFLSKAVVPFH
jgi:hypothetical protein